MLDACHVAPDVQSMIFSGTMWRILWNNRKRWTPIMEGEDTQVA
jgi:hypothetical protein